MELLRKLIIIFLIISSAAILLNSCCISLYINSRKAKRGIIASSDIKWTGKDTGISNKIRVDGFYADSCSNEILIFFEDGTSAKCWTECIDFEKMKTDLASQLYDNGYKKGKWGYEIGIYEMRNDTIVANYYYSDFFMFCNLWRYMTKIEYKIENSNSIRVISQKGFGRADFEGSTFKFHHSNIMPSSNNKMKNKKWLWKDIDTWREFNKNK